MTSEQLLKGVNQSWRRDIKEVDELGVTVTQGERVNLARFRCIYLETAERDHSTGRGLPYFETIWDVLNVEEPDRMRVYLVEYESDLVAATTFIRIGIHARYSYDASTTTEHEIRGSNAAQWRVIRNARGTGTDVYDPRGITKDLTTDDPKLGPT